MTTQISHQLFLPEVRRIHIYLVVHLLGAVEHVDHDAKCSPEVLGGFRLARAGRTSRGSTHGQMERLGECDVAPGTKRLHVYKSTWLLHVIMER